MQRTARQPQKPKETERFSGMSRAGWVYDQLLSEIHAGKFKRGERIRESEVAAALGVSRTPVREALARLHARALLELAPGGLVVAQLNRSQTVELYAIREILEGSAARFAAKHAAPSEIATLHQIAREFARHGDDPEMMARVNREFHATIYEAAHNRYLMRMLDEVHDALALVPGTTFSVKGRPEAAILEHAAILEAIEQHDPDAAERAARLHIERAQEVRLALLFSIR